MKTFRIIDFGPHEGPAVCVVGSLNADLIAYESDTWIPGAYNVGDRFEMGAGGKGLNVAMSIAATGLPSYLVGRVGNDMFGHFLKRALMQGSVNHDLVKTDPTAFTGIGHVRVKLNATTTPALYRGPTITSTPPIQRLHSIAGFGSRIW